MPPQVRTSGTDRIESAGRRDRQVLLVGLLALGVVLSFSVVPGIFLVDENNYLVNVLALRQGRVTLANTEGLPPSSELLFFDPTNRSRNVTSTPVASTAPPLYAFLALPFSVFGWRGLVALNTLAYLVTILLVFRYAQRYATDTSTPWLAAAAFAFGGFTIEYALGLWPQALSFVLCTAGIVAAGRVIDEDGGPVRTTLAAAGAGALLGLATGVRYQNAVVVTAVGGALFLLTSSRRWRACAAYCAAAAIPLVASAAMNHARFDSWNPISKGPGYLSVPVSDVKSALFDPLVMFWGQVVDYSVRPELPDVYAKKWLRYDPMTGAHLIHGAMTKKAVMQSAPWVILAFLLFVAAWLPTARMSRERRQQLRLMSVVAAAIVAAFSMSGVGRHDGLAFNARYFLELVPLAAVGFAWALDGRGPLRVAPCATGAAVGGALAAVILLGTPLVGGPDNPLWIARQLGILKVPLVLAGAVAGVWLLDAFGSRRPALLLATAGACLGWGSFSHLSMDVGLSQYMRDANLKSTRALTDVVPDRSAIVAHWGHADAAGPLLFTRDIVILDAAADATQDAPGLIRSMLGSGRRVFVLDEGFTRRDFRTMVDGLTTTPLVDSHLPVLEVRPGPGG